MEDDDRPALAGVPSAGWASSHAAPAKADGAAGLLARESLDSFSRDELDHRVALLEAEIARVKAHAKANEAHRLAAEQLFSRKGP